MRGGRGATRKCQCSIEEKLKQLSGGFAGNSEIAMTDDCCLSVG